LLRHVAVNGHHRQSEKLTITKEDLMKALLRNLLIVSAVLCGMPFPGSAAPYDGRNMRFLYAPNIVGNQDPSVRSQLTQLQNAGINVITIGAWSVADLEQQVQAVRRDPLLSGFKVVLMVSGPTSDGWIADEQRACAQGAERLPLWLEEILDGTTALALQNSDLVVGYYTFDEPAIPRGVSQLGVCKRYQELVYERIRNADPDKNARPVMIANLMGSMTDQQIQYAMSPRAQDIVFVDQYQDDEAQQAAQYAKWKRHNLLSVPMIPVLPAFHYSSCVDPRLRTSFRPKLQRALTSVYGASKPANYGDAYFAYWPGQRPDFSFDAQNCQPILDSVIDDLTVKPDLKVVSIQTTPMEFRPGDPVSFNVTIRNDGNGATPPEAHGVLIHENGQCFDSGCPWGIYSGQISPGQEITVSLTSSPVWRPSAGLHTLTAEVDDVDRIKESNEQNNSLSREIAVGEKPDLQTYILQTIPDSFLPGQEVRFRSAITNRGSVATPPGFIGVVYMIDGSCPSAGRCPYGGMTGSLAPGQSIWIEPLEFSWPATAGVHQFGAMVDDMDRISEQFEDNNWVTRSIHVSTKPDLRVVSASTIPASPRAGDAVRFSAIVENVGSVQSNAPWFGLLAMQNYQCFPAGGCVWGGLQNQVIAPGGRVQLNTYSGNWYPTAGLHQLQMFVDDSNQVDESDEANNILEFTSEVR
jgi:CARDB